MRDCATRPETQIRLTASTSAAICASSSSRPETFASTEGARGNRARLCFRKGRPKSRSGGPRFSWKARRTSGSARCCMPPERAVHRLDADEPGIDPFIRNERIRARQVDRGESHRRPAACSSRNSTANSMRPAQVLLGQGDVSFADALANQRRRDQSAVDHRQVNDFEVDARFAAPGSERTNIAQAIVAEREVWAFDDAAGERAVRAGCCRRTRVRRAPAATARCETRRPVMHRLLEAG